MRMRRAVLIPVVSCLVAAPAAGAAQPAPAPACSGTTCTITFPFVGDAYDWVVPANVSGPITFDVVGAHGGVGPAGGGARVQAAYAATAGETLRITPGGKGGDSGAWTPGGGGYNGGAPGYYYFSNTSSPRVNTFGGGGGGASDVRAGGTDLASRILVAGGGGGGSRVENYLCYGWYCDPARYYGAGGDAGRLGGNGTGGNGGQPGGGGTQVAGGAGGGSYWYRAASGMFGVGGNAAGDGSYGGGGGGGGGWYGGGGGTLGPGGVSAGGGGAGSSYAADALTGVSFTSGYGSGDGSVTATFAITDAPMLVDASPTPIAPMVRGAYAYQFTATGNPAPTFGIASGALPDGMALDPATGMLSGMPTAAGTATFKIVATNVHGSATSGTLRITTGNRPMFTRMAPPPTAGLHMRYRYVFRAMGGPVPRITVAKGALPPGLTLRPGAKPGSAVLVGRPTRAGRYVFTLRATSSTGSVTQRVALAVAPHAPMPMASLFDVTRSGDGRLVIRTKLMPMASSPVRRVRVAVYDRKRVKAVRQDVPSGSASITDVGARIADGTATAGAGSTPLDVVVELDDEIGSVDLPLDVTIVITTTDADGMRTQQMYTGRLRMA